MKRSTNMARSVADHRPSRELGGARMRFRSGLPTGGSPGRCVRSASILSLASTNDRRVLASSRHLHCAPAPPPPAAQRPRAQLPGGLGTSRPIIAHPDGQGTTPFPHASRVSCSELLGMPQVCHALLEDLLRFRGGVTCAVIELVCPGPTSVAPNSEYGAPGLGRPLLGPCHEGPADASPPPALVDNYAAELCEGWNKEPSRHECVQ